jgi:hypothetical protein
MPLYMVKHEGTGNIASYNAVSPSKAACKAFASQRRKGAQEKSMMFRVTTEGLVASKVYTVGLKEIVSQNEHEAKHNITHKAVARKITPDFLILDTFES